MTSKGTSTEAVRELRLLEALEESPEIKQVDLAARLGVAVGTVNWLLKRLAAQGHVKVKRMGQWRWRYLITPQGVAAKAKLTKTYIQRSMQLYRETRRQARELLQEVKQAAYDHVQIIGDAGNDIVDVCRLTCMEQGIKIVSSAGSELPPTHYSSPTTSHTPRTTNHEPRATYYVLRTTYSNIPVLHIDGQELFLEWPERAGE